MCVCVLEVSKYIYVCVLEVSKYIYVCVLEVLIFTIYLYYFPLGRHGRDRMVVGFTTTCTTSAYHH